MRILFLCGREIDYPRNQILLRAFESIGEVNLVAEQGVKSSIILRSIRVLFRALPKLLFNKFDFIFIGFYGYLLVPFSKLAKQTPVLFDAFVSNFDTLISDRKVASEKSLLAKIALRLDRIGCSIADIVLVDTHAHAKYFSNTLGIPSEKIIALPVGAIDTIFFPRPTQKHNKTINVLYYCTYLPVHGAPVVVEAANLIKNENIQFKIIGMGPEYSIVEKMIESMNLTNIQLQPDLPIHKIADEIANADICLGGHFGNSPKAERTIPGKIYQILAAGKPVIATNTEANRELLIHLENAYLCSAANSYALAEAITGLSINETLRNQIGVNGRYTYMEKCSEIILSAELNEIVKRVVMING